MVICRQAFWASGSDPITVSMVTPSLLVGGGILIVQGALGTQPYQSSCRGKAPLLNPGLGFESHHSLAFPKGRTLALRALGLQLSVPDPG